MILTEKATLIEAILFATGEPVDSDKLAETIEIDKTELPKLIELLNESYLENKNALIVLHLGNNYQLAVKSEFNDIIKIAFEKKKSVPLSQAAMEVLTIIAYNQPVTKRFVEHIRGIDSSSIVNTLVEKKLLEEAGRLDVPGKPIAYKTTSTFLRCFSLESLDDLPPLPNTNKDTFDAMIIQDDDDDNME